MADSKDNYASQEHVIEQSDDDLKNNEDSTGQHEEQCMPSHEEEEMAIRKKYGGIIPKKPPLISKDHERAFFDSADWALGKQGAPMGQKPKGPLEALRPKLQPTPHQQNRSRRTSYARHEGEEGAVVSSEEANGHE